MILLNCKEFAEAAARGDLEDASPWVRFSAWMHLRICPPCRKFMRQLRLIAASARAGARDRFSRAEMDAFLARTVDFLAGR